MQELRALTHVRATVARLNPRRNQQLVRKNRRLVGMSIIIRIFQDQDFIVRLLSWRDLRIDRRTRNPKPSLRIEIDLDWLRELRILREQRNFKAGLNLKFRNRLWSKRC